MSVIGFTEPIDFISLLSNITGGRGYEVKPGIQFGGGITRKIERGEIAYFNLIVQNALNTPVTAEIRVGLPLRKMFKNTNLSTVSPTLIELGPSEVEQVNIPIKTSQDTPEGDYEIVISITGSGGEGGKRVRGIKKELQNKSRISITKSAAASAAITAFCLFFLTRKQ